MKTIGLVGGTGWISTIDYYRFINLEVNARRGGQNTAKIVLYSVDFGEIDAFHAKGDIDGVGALLTDASKKLVSIGADCILLCANTMHMHAERVQAAVPVPLIHIVEATAKQIRAKSMKKIGLLGTRMTMEREFYKKKLNDAGIEVLVPEKEERDFIQRTINDELVKNLFLPKSKAGFLEIIKKLKTHGAEGVILGCTEIPLLVKQEDTDLPVFDTTHIHSLAAVDFALSD
ncbi:MAG: aspartate/glutamate racemase family protein [Ignavibacteriales bacterium]|nr:aspartate/glutamate racemase family protein [Ignavibacteriales bacterium]